MLTRNTIARSLLGCLLFVTAINAKADVTSGNVSSGATTTYVKNNDEFRIFTAKTQVQQGSRFFTQVMDEQLLASDHHTRKTSRPYYGKKSRTQSVEMQSGEKKTSVRKKTKTKTKKKAIKKILKSTDVQPVKKLSGSKKSLKKLKHRAEQTKSKKRKTGKQSKVSKKGIQLDDVKAVAEAQNGLAFYADSPFSVDREGYKSYQLSKSRTSRSGKRTQHLRQSEPSSIQEFLEAEFEPESRGVHLSAHGRNALRINEGRRIMETFEEWRGVRYRYGGSSKRGVDCSSFVQQVMRTINISLPRSTGGQINYGQKISPQNLNPGDLVFFKTDRWTRHVGIYVGEGKFIHASRKNGVTMSELSRPYWKSKFIAAKRVLKPVRAPDMAMLMAAARTVPSKGSNATTGNDIRSIFNKYHREEQAQG